MSNQSINNVKGVFSKKGPRVILIMTFGFIGAGVLLANMSTSNQESRPKELQAVVGAPDAPSISSVPGTSDNPLHNAKVRDYNAQKAKEAEASGGSAVPRLTQTADREKDPFDLLNKKPESAARVQEQAVPMPSPQRQAQAPMQQQAQPAAQPVVKSQGQIQAEKDMSAAMAGLLTSWQPTRQVIETEITPGKNGQQQAQMVQASAQAAAPAPLATSSASDASSKKVAIKAGTVLHAVVITSVNSDEPGPVLAQITTGPYAGGRLLGKFDLAKESGTVIVTFSALTMKHAESSYKINSFAVNPETARTGLSTDVDRHYLSRYGLFAAAQFTKGYGQALTQSGATQTIVSGPGGVSSTTSYPQLSNKQIALSALGTLGEEVGNSLKDGLRRPPTVTLNSGTEIGVLIMQDAAF
jgi:intracellular multiplication protein IcmE